jgi:hypothetical protein
MSRWQSEKRQRRRRKPNISGAPDAGKTFPYLATGALLRTFLNPTFASGDQFGSEVALFGSRVLISAILDDTGATNAGSAYLFDITTGALLRTFNNPTPALNDTFGFDIALSGSKALIGATQDDVNGFNEGTAYLFDLATGTLSHTRFIPSPNGNSEFLGEGIALSDNWVGATFDNSQGADRGAVYRSTPTRARSCRKYSTLSRPSMTASARPWRSTATRP